MSLKSEATAATERSEDHESIPIPVRVTGPGSHDEDEPLQYFDMPREISTFRMPSVPETDDARVAAVARDTLAGCLR